MVEWFKKMTVSCRCRSSSGRWRRCWPKRVTMMITINYRIQYKEPFNNDKRATIQTAIQASRKERERDRREIINIIWVTTNSNIKRFSFPYPITSLRETGREREALHYVLSSSLTSLYDTLRYVMMRCDTMIIIIIIHEKPSSSFCAFFPFYEMSLIDANNKQKNMFLIKRFPLSSKKQKKMNKKSRKINNE